MNLAADASGRRAPRLLMTTDAVGGVWSYALTLCRELVPRGYEILLANMGPPPTAEQVRAARGLPGVDLEIGDFALEWMDEPWSDVDRAAPWLLGLAERFGADIVHLNGYCHASLKFSVPAVVVGHSCVVSWWHAVLQDAPPSRYDEYRRRVREGLLRAAHVLAPTAAMLSELARHYGPLPSASVIHNGVAGQAVTSTERRLVLGVGRAWDPAKNASLLAGVARQIPVPVEWAGEAVSPNGTSQDLDGLRLLGRVEPHAMPQLLSRALVFAHPARYEPFGLAPVEAALGGCALVLADIPSLREVWGDAALYAAPDDVEAWAQTIQALCADSDRCARVARRATARARRYSPAAMGARYHELYEQLNQRGRRAAPTGTSPRPQSVEV